MEDCIFCKIVSGDISSYKIYEDDICIAFVDIHPVSPGHILIVPKSHYRWFQDVPDTELSFIFLTAKKMIPKLKEKLNADYVQLSVVGKDVPHFHLHLIPRKLSDNINISETLELNKQELEDLASLLVSS